jgi:hypothetical protein
MAALLFWKSSTKQSCFSWVGAVEPRQRLHRLDADSGLSTYDRVQQWLVVAGLEFVGTNQKSVRVGLWILRSNIVTGEPLSDASLTLLPPYSCSPEKATIAW